MSGLSDDDVASFAALGLDPVAIAVYEAVLLLDTWTPQRLAERLGQDEASVLAALDLLLRRRLLMPSQEGVDRLRAVDPRVGLTRLIDEYEATLRSAHERLGRTRLAAQQLIGVVDAHDLRERTSLEQVAGRDGASDRISELLAEAGSEVMTVLTTLPDTAALARARPGDIMLLERGVRTRMLVLAGHLRRSPGYVAYLDDLVGLGAEVRVATTLPTRLIVVDESLAVVPTSPGEPGSGATIVRHHGLIRLLRDTFEAHWRSAAALGDDAGRTAGWEPSELDLEVIRLLGQGEKDEAIARRVGLSLRSVRRLVATISQEVGSSSRFELGMICASRGWTSIGAPRA